MTNRWFANFGLVAFSMAALAVTPACSSSDNPAPVTRRGGSSGSSGGSSGSGGSNSGSGGSSSSGGSTGSGGSASGGSTGSSGGSTGTGGSASGGSTGTGGAASGGSGGAASGGATGTGGTPAGTGGATMTPDAGMMETSAPPAGACAMGWTIAASALCNNSACANIPTSAKDIMGAIDNDSSTRYASGVAQGSAGPETVTVTFPATIKISGVTLSSQGGDGITAYKAEFSTDGTTFQAFTPASEGPGTMDETVIMFPAATSMKAVRITQTGMKSPNWWSIHELGVLGCMAQ